MHPDELKAIHDKANGDAAEEKKLTEAVCYRVQCWAQYSPNSNEWLQNYVSPQDAAGLTSELSWVDSQRVPGGQFDYTLGQRATDIGLSQWDQFSRGAQQFGQDVRNLPHDFVHQVPQYPNHAQGDANPLIDVTNGGNGTPPTATAVVTPAPCPVGPGACGIVVTPVISPGTPILSNGGNGGDDSPSSNASVGGNSQGGNGVDVSLRYKDGWTDAQRAAADAKVQALNSADLTVTPPQRSGTSASSRYKAAGGTVPQGSDVDHTVDLQLGGADNLSNMAPLDSSVNRSLGAQVQQQIKGLPPGTPINGVTIRNR